MFHVVHKYYAHRLNKFKKSSFRVSLKNKNINLRVTHSKQLMDSIHGFFGVY